MREFEGVRMCECVSVRGSPDLCVSAKDGGRQSTTMCVCVHMHVHMVSNH